MATRMSANALNAESFLSLTFTAAGMFVTEATYGLLCNEARDSRRRSFFEPVKNASFLYSGRPATSGSATPERFRSLLIDEVRLVAETVRARDGLFCGLDDESTIVTSGLSTGTVAG